MLNAMKEKSYKTTCQHVKNIDIPANTQERPGNVHKMSWTFQRRHCNAFVSWDTLLSTHSYTYSNENWHTLKCLSIGTPKAIKFPFVSNEKLMFFRCPSIQAHCNEAVIYLNFGTPKNNEFSIWNKWKIYYF